MSLRATESYVFFIFQAELVQWDSMCQALHHRIEETSIPPIFHAECDLLVGKEQLRALHILIDLIVRSFLELAFEIGFIKFSLKIISQLSYRESFE